MQGVPQPDQNFQGNGSTGWEKVGTFGCVSRAADTFFPDPSLLLDKGTGGATLMAHFQV